MMRRQEMDEIERFLKKDWRFSSIAERIKCSLPGPDRDQMMDGFWACLFHWGDVDVFIE
jgi:hypothetical protein